jgi:hypothetical protein
MRLIIGILLTIGGILFFWKALVVHNSVSAAANWPYVEGKIIESKLSPHIGDGESLYDPDVIYSYTVNDRKYVSV